MSFVRSGDEILRYAQDDEGDVDSSKRHHALTPHDTVLIAAGVGFMAAWGHGDPGYGAYIDNLHVHPERGSHGVQVAQSRMVWRDVGRLADACSGAQ